jgi:hypothetical protein
MITEWEKFAKEQMLAAHAALRMIGDAVEELFGPIASLESEEGTLHRGPEFHHRAEGIIEALQRVAARLNHLETEPAEKRHVELR